MAGNPTKDSKDDLAYCPHLPDGRAAAARVSRGIADASDLAIDVRERDLAEVWGRVLRWSEQDPIRLAAAVVTLAAMVPLDQDGLLDWTVNCGGLAGLQPRPPIPRMRGERAA
ncbi:hypothetical protein ABZ215_33515 [Amycolatopsis sp. NPDC006131]|uniref:hypothetical protein n=1 Tax=Amycolatopsis sp. NPDC006131 TaxID=3156731 RepID=UPI0033A73385